MTVAVNVETFHLTAKINLLVALKETPDANKRPKDLFSGNRDCWHKTIFARPSAAERDILRQIGPACEVTHQSANRIQSEDQNFQFWSSFRNPERHWLAAAAVLEIKTIITDRAHTEQPAPPPGKQPIYSLIKYIIASLPWLKFFFSDTFQVAS